MCMQLYTTFYVRLLAEHILYEGTCSSNGFIYSFNFYHAKNDLYNIFCLLLCKKYRYFSKYLNSTYYFVFILGQL